MAGAAGRGQCPAGGGGAGGADHAAAGGALANAYRANALAEPAYHGVMFQQAISRFRPSAASLAGAGASLEVLAQAVAAATSTTLVGTTPSQPAAKDGHGTAAEGGVPAKLDLDGRRPGCR